MKPPTAIAIILSIVAIAAVWASTVEQFEPAQPTSSRLVTVTNFPNPQNVAGSVNVGNFPVDDDGRLLVSRHSFATTVLLNTPLTLEANGTYVTEPVASNEYAAFGYKATVAPPDTCHGAPWLTVTPEWRWDPSLPFTSVDNRLDGSGTCSGNGAGVMCMVSGPELRLVVRNSCYDEARTITSIALILKN